MQMSSKLEVLIFLVAEALLTTPHNILQKKKPNKKIMLQGSSIFIGYFIIITTGRSKGEKREDTVISSV